MYECISQRPRNDTQRTACKKGFAWAILWAIFLFVPVVSVHAAVVETYPWTGINSETVSGSNFLWQPIGLTTAASGTILAEVHVYGSITTNTNDGVRWQLRQYEHVDFSGTQLQSCEFRLYTATNNDPVPVGTYTGYLTFRSAVAPCILNDNGFYIMRFGSTFGNATFYLQGNIPLFGSQDRVRRGTAWDTATEDNNIQAFWFQWHNSTSTTIGLLTGNISTSSEQSRGDLIAAVDSETNCQTAATTLSYSLCRVFTFLFAPQPSTLGDYAYLWGTISAKPPFGYLAGVQTAFSGFSSTTAATSSSSYLYEVSLAAVSIYGSFGTTTQDKISIVIWVMFAIYLLLRIAYFNFHM